MNITGTFKSSKLLSENFATAQENGHLSLQRRVYRNMIFQWILGKIKAKLRFKRELAKSTLIQIVCVDETENWNNNSVI